MTASDRPQLACRHLSAFSIEDWDHSLTALRQAPACTLGQYWCSKPQKDFLPATVRTGWTDRALVVLAELEDSDIFNPVTEFNAMSFQSGDVFEMFLRPEEQSAYCEFHISPQNQRLQLRFPSSDALRKPRQEPGIPKDWMIYDRQIDSRVRIDAAHNRWWVLAALPVDMVADSKRVGPGSRWLFSFSRYDYTRGTPAPVLSSTSPHREVNFHRQQEWGTLLFESLTSE
jgi:hypothetical protein